MKGKFFMQGLVKLSNIQPLILVWITRYNFASILSSEKVNTECHFILLLISPFYESPHFSVVCGDGSCDTDQSEDCSTCPKDCGKCPLQTHEIALIAVFSCLVVIAGIVVFIVSKIDSGKKLQSLYDKMFKYSWCTTELHNLSHSKTLPIWMNGFGSNFTNVNRSNKNWFHPKPRNRYSSCRTDLL